MRHDDLMAISGLGNGLWADGDRSGTTLLDTFAAVSLLGLEEESLVDRVALSLLEVARRDGPSVNAVAMHSPFFRLLPEERFVLSALHLGKWSYRRLSRILSEPVERVAEIAWAARIDLASQPSQRAGKPFSPPHPTGSGGTSCPEYHPARPWTQRFFDRELEARERIFLESHLARCKGCQTALTRSREVWYAAEAYIPRLAPELEAARLRQFQRILRRAVRLVRPVDRSFFQALEIFSRRRDVRWAAGLLAALLVFCSRH